MQVMQEDGASAEVEYSPELLSFDHEGFTITNPFLSECGRFVVDPRQAYGFDVADDGFGGLCMQRPAQDGSSIRLVGNGMLGLPRAQDWEQSVISRIAGDGRVLASASMEEVLGYQADE